MLKNICVFASGGGSNLQSIIDRSSELGVNLSLVISDREDAYALERARKHKIRALYLDHGEEDYLDKILEVLEEEEVELLVLAGYLKFVEKRLIDSYKNRIINIHPSLLPSFGGKGCYGRHVHEKVYERGVRLTGATVHFVDEGADTGPIILQEAVYLDHEDSIDRIAEKVLEIEHRLLPEAIKLFAEDRLVVEDSRVKIL